MSADQPTLTETLDALFAPLNRSDAPGAVVGVAKDGKVLYRKGFGLANVEHGVANAPRTKMRIGSTTKHFTCLAALLLAEAGKLDVDAGIRSYLPEVPALEGDPTLRQLMNHAGGYRCYIDLGFIADGEAVHPAPEALAAQVRQANVNFPPGQRTIYNNGGYNLLSLAMERVTGQPFRSVLDDKIFQPMGMADTRLVESDMEVVPGLAGLYVKRGEGWRRGIFITEGLRGEGGMISTVDDMLHWLAHLRAPGVVGSAETWRQMTKPAVLNNGFVSAYGLGLIVDAYRGARVIHHGGSVTGGQCQMITAPDHGLDIIIITNGGWMGAAPASPDELGYKIMDAVLGDEVLGPRPVPPATDAYRGLLGQYHCRETGMVMGIEDMDGKLGLNILAGMPMVLDQTDEGLVSPFTKTVVGHFVIPAVEGPDAAQTVTITDSGNPDTFRRLPDKGPPVETIAPLLEGQGFYAHDIDARASFRREGEALELHVQGPYGRSVWIVTALSDDVLTFSFKGRIPWRGVINLERQGGRVAGFAMTSRRTRNLRFEPVP